MKKKLLSILLSIGLVLTMIPATAFADTTIGEVNLSIQTNFGAKTLTVTPAEGEKGNYDESDLKGFDIYLIDKEGNFAYGYHDGEGTTEWTDGEDEIDETEVDMGNIDYIIWYFYLVTKSSDYTFKEDVVTKVNGETLNKVTMNENDMPISTGYHLDTSDYQGLDIYIREDLPKTSQDVVGTTGSTTEDVEVGYTYLAESNTAAKVFNVTIDYTFPAALNAKGAQNTYTWDPVGGKYTKDETSTAESYTLSNKGEFEITVTNHSNVNIDYTVSYAADANAVFASALDGNMTNDTGTVNTVAQGHEVTADGINITNANTATAAMTGDFYNATCTGKLKVTGINTGKTPLSSGKDTLGTFTIGISEKVAVK